MFPAQIALFINPQMGYKYGQSGNAKELWPYVRKMIIWLPIITIPVSILIWLTAPWLLETFFPKYIDSTWAMKIMSVGFIFSAAFITHGVLYTVKAYNYAYLYLFVELSGSFIFPMFFVKVFPFDVLTSVALGISTLSFILYILNGFILRKVLFLSKYNVI